MIWFIMFLLVNLPVLNSQTLPPDVSIQKDFVRGVGLSIGKVLVVQGEAVVIHHHNKQVGYRMVKDLPLYQKDKILTMANGRISFQLNDGSVMSMSSDATMTINKSVFDSHRQDRTLFMNMPRGKSRFTVKKLKHFKRSAVKIKTSTAIIGVRGSDFIVMATEQSTEIVTLDETILGINSLFDPTAEAVILDAYERSQVDEQALPTLPEAVRPEELESIMDEFSFSAQTALQVNKPSTQTMTQSKSSAKQTNKSTEKQSGESKKTSSKPLASKTEGSKSDATKVAKSKSSEAKSAPIKSEATKSAQPKTVSSAPVSVKSPTPQPDTPKPAAVSQPIENQPVALQTPASQPSETLPLVGNLIETPEPIAPEMPESLPVPEVIPDFDPIQDISSMNISELQVDIVEEVVENEIQAKLPGFPLPPKR